MNREVDLSGLRDIHIPQEPNWWPLAVGWWILIIGCVIAILAGLCFFLYWRSLPKQYALRTLKKTYQIEKNPILFARMMSMLLKRVALSRFPRTKVAHLSEEKWIAFLQKKVPSAFSNDELELLANSMYMPEATQIDIPIEHLYSAGRQAIRDLFKKDKHGKSSTKSV